MIDYRKLKPSNLIVPARSVSDAYYVSPSERARIARNKAEHDRLFITKTGEDVRETGNYKALRANFKKKGK